MSKNLILILNCGSSSLKFAILDPKTGDEKLSGLAEAFHLEDARIKWKLHGEKGNADLGAGAAHSEALSFIANELLSEELKASIGAIGHRIVHGGERFTSSVVINDDVIKGIEDAVQFAPLHNPAHLIGIQEAFLYALPYNLYTEHHIRRYGAHGTSHLFISREVAERVGKPADQVNTIVCHLGNGGSVSVVRNGKCIDTSMGLTPLEGLVMGTRSGDIDPAIIFYLYKNLGMSMEEIETTLVKKSGLLGLTQVTSDCRYSEDNYDDASKPEAKRALDVYSYRLAKYIGAYMAILGDDHLDAIAFTGGIGENSAHVRELTLNHLKLFGVKLDHDRNLAARFGKEGVITADDSAFKAIVIPTNEELVIAQDTAKLAL